MWLEVLYCLPKNVCVVPVVPVSVSRCSFHMFCFCMSKVISSFI